MAKKAYIGVDGVARKVKKGYVGVPMQYIELSYIQSGGSQYIDTEFKPTGSTKVVCDFKMLNQGSSQQGVFGSRPGTSGRFTVFTGNTTADLQVDYNTEQTLASVSSSITGLNVNSRTTLEVSNSLVINGTTVKTVSAASFASTYNLFLFANNNVGTAQLPGSMKLYYCQIYDNGTLVRDFVPCINEDGEVGLYDRVNSKFYGNAGTGTFSAGTETGEVISTNCVARRIKKVYIGVGGVARPCWSGGEPTYYGAITSLSASRAYHAATTVGDYALFGGGQNTALQSGVDAYNTSLIRTSAPNLSRARRWLTAATVGEYALFVGGSNLSTTIYTTVDGYDSSLTKVSSVTNISLRRYFLAATSVGNYALFGGGLGENSSAYKSTVDAYDASLTRTTPTALSVARFHLTATAVGNYALFGGGYTNKSRDTVDAYDGSLTRTIPIVLNTPREKPAATTVGNYALFGGGWDSTLLNPSSDMVDAYDTSLTRTNPTALSVARYTLAATTILDCALFAGGRDRNASLVTVDAYDTSLTRSNPAALSVARFDLVAATVGNYALFSGGCPARDSYTDVVEAYTIA